MRKIKLPNKESTPKLTPFKGKVGYQLTTDQRHNLINDLMDILLEGYQSDHQLSERLGYSRNTIAKYKKFAIKLLSKNVMARPQIRALQLSRAYQDIENLTKELQQPNLTISDKMSIYAQKNNVNKHIALIAGLNIETKVSVDHKQLVITRANPEETRKIVESGNVTVEAVDTNEEEEIEEYGEHTGVLSEENKGTGIQDQLQN
jgi:hypothetical protein